MATGYVVLDSTWARRLGVRRSSGGIYRIARWQLMEQLKQLQLDSMEQVVSSSGAEGIRGFTDSKPALVLDDIVGVESHPHFVEFYETEAFLVDCVQDFLGAGVVADNAVIMLATDAHRSAFDRALLRAGIDVQGAQRSGRFVAQDASEALASFMVEGMPDPGRFRATIGQLIPQAVQKGRDVRIYSEMVAMLWDEGNVPAAIVLEDLWNDLAIGYPFSLFCACPAHAFVAAESAGGYRTICGQHSRVILHCVPEICGSLCATCSVERKACVPTVRRR